MSDVRAVAVGIPERLQERLEAVAGVLLVDSLMAAAAALADHGDRVAVLYGEGLFGEAVTGQPVFLLDEQNREDASHRWGIDRVIVITDRDPQSLEDLEWDDPRRLSVQAALRLGARYFVDLSVDGATNKLSGLLAGMVDTPHRGGYHESNGNDEPNGDPDEHQ